MNFSEKTFLGVFGVVDHEPGVHRLGILLNDGRPIRNELSEKMVLGGFRARDRESGFLQVEFPLLVSNGESGMEDPRDASDRRVAAGITVCHRCTRTGNRKISWMPFLIHVI